MRVAEMEFLGSFWRARLTDEGAGDIHVECNFSINAVRRMAIAPGKELVIEIPSNRLKLFTAGKADG